MTVKVDDQAALSWLWPQWIARGSLSILRGQDRNALTSVALMLANSAAWGENVHGIPLQEPADGEEQVAVVVTRCDLGAAHKALAASLLGISPSLLLADITNFALTTKGELKLDLGQMLGTYAQSGFFPTLLAFDPWHQFLPGGNLTPRQLALKLVPPLLGLAQRYDCALLFTQWTAAPQMFEAVRDFADSVIEVQRDDATNVYTLVRPFSRLSPDQAHATFEFSP